MELAVDLETFGRLALAGGCLIIAIVAFRRAMFLRRKRLKPSSCRETSELMFRDPEGKLCSVFITIDHDDNALPFDPSELDSMMIGRGRATFAKEGKMSEVTDFVFPAAVANQMRASGVEPDEVVAKMLKEAGRMAR